MTFRVVRLLTAILIGIAVSVSLAGSPAMAASCSPGSGVTVVVGSSASCDVGGGGTAADNFAHVGHRFTYVDQQPGFVCKIDDAPSSARCAGTPPANAYWALWWSNGKTGTWSFSTLGVQALNVPDGGSVAFVFGNGRTPPGVTPPVRVEAAPPTSKPSTKPSAKPTAKVTRKPAKTPTTSAPSAKPTTPTPAITRATNPAATATPSGATPTPSATTLSAPVPTGPTPTTPQSTDEITPAASTDGDSGSGPLGWAAGALVVVLLGGMGLVVWRRKAAGGTS